MRFEREQRQALRPLPARPLPTRGRRRCNDALIDIDAVRYSVPHRLVRDHVEVLVTATEVRVYHGRDLIAVRTRSHEPHAYVVNPAHFEGFWRRTPVENGSDLHSP